MTPTNYKINSLQMPNNVNMNATSIATYIADLEKENKDLRAQLKLTQKWFQSDSDTESVASNDAADAEWIESDSDTESSVTSNEVGDDEFFVSHNTDLADVLDSLCYYETNEHKKKAYDDAAYAVYKLPYKVTNGDELASGPNKVPGIGKSIATKINEFLETGKIKRLQDLKIMAKTDSIHPFKRMEKDWSAVDETHDDYFAGGHNDALVRHLKNMASEESDEFKAAASRKRRKPLTLSTSK